MQNSLFPEEIVFPEIIQLPVMWGYSRNLHKTDRFKALVDFNTGKLFSIVSKDYKIIRHEEAIEQVEEVIADTSGLGRFEIYTDFYNDGGRMRRTYRFIEKSVEIAKSDEVNPELYLFNSYDVTWPFIVLLGAFRFVCENGLVVGEKFLYLRKRHIYELDTIGLKEEISTALKRFNLQTQEWKTWTNHQLTSKTYRQVMEAMKLGKKATQEIEKRLDHKAKGLDDNDFPIITLWVFYNILTRYITYKAVSLNHRVEMEKRLRAAVKHFRKTRERRLTL